MKLKIIRLVNCDHQGCYLASAADRVVHRVYDTDAFGNLVSVPFVLSADNRTFKLVNVNKGQIYVKIKRVKVPK